MIATTPIESTRQQAREWSAQDPDQQTRSAVDELLASAEASATNRAESDEQLRNLFEGRIGFGTAGLRAAMGPGPRRMNRLVVRQTTVGLMKWLEPGSKVVIGFDARHHSEVFALDVARMVIASGGQAELLPAPLPTPVLAHAVLDRQADAGVMITASHNPPADNGYKLYLSDGIQLVAPADAEIAAAIDEVAKGPLPEFDQAATDGQIVRLDDSLAQNHLTAAVAACKSSERAVKVVYTAMHGVGGEHLLKAFRQAGFPAPIVVPEQFDPDPDFPTAKFPNPEEPGALDLGLALAEKEQADVLMANDPDADRLSLAVPARTSTNTDSANTDSEFQPLSGDQTGVLLADHLLRAGTGTDRIVAMSIVSSSLLQSMAEAHGVQCAVTLTGFKWVARPIVDSPNDEYVFGYEEALGYCCGDRVRDKDGISAALVAAEIVADLVAKGRTMWDRLDELAIQHGAHLTGPVTVRFEGPEGNSLRSSVMDRLLANPPTTLGDEALAEGIDMSKGKTLPPTTGLILLFDGDTRVIIRPSGTEPKLKAYIEVIEPVEKSAGASAGVAESGEIEAAWARAAKRLNAAQKEIRSLLSGD